MSSPRESSNSNASPTSGNDETARRLQQRLIDALSEPSRYPHPVERVERVQTHISTLLLAGDYVYKIKKPLELEFVDYSALERRRFFCEEEVRLNRRFAPDIYLACVAIRGSVDDPVWDGHGAAIEYAVKMRRFPHHAQADVLARKGALTPTAMEALADMIARYHADAPRQGWERIYGLPKTVEREALDNAAQLQAELPDMELRAAGAELAAWTRTQCRDLHDVFSERVEAGFIRECHGDLHLANLILRQKRWSAFDCIEFDAHLRWIDVMSDVAFTLMDLHAFEAPDLAHRLLNRYLEITGDYAGLAVLRFYLVYRALIRAKVMALSAREARTPDERKQLIARHRAYLGTATALARPASPRLIITHGVSGSGKSWAARWAADRLGYVRIRSDLERKRLHNLSPDARTHSAPGAGIYTWADSHNTYRRLFELAEYALSSGWRVILDAAFLDREQRDEAHVLARRLNCPFTILTLTTPAELARQRVRARGASDVSEATESILDAQLEGYEPLSADERAFSRRTASDAEELEVTLRDLEAG